MPIVDFNTPEPWDSLRIWRSPVTSMLRQKVSESGVHKSSGSVLEAWKNIPQVFVGFCRFPIMQINDRFRGPNMPKNLNIGPGDRVLLMGDVYGWTAESLAENVPLANFVSVDSTPLTQARCSLTETNYLRNRIVVAGVTGGSIDLVLSHLDNGLQRASRTVLDEDASDQASRDRIITELGGLPTHCITTGMFNYMFDSECVDMSARLHDMNPGRVFHIVNTFNKPAHGKAEMEPALNWKWATQDQPRDTFIRNEVGDIRPLDSESNIEARSWKALLPNDWIVPEGTSYNVYF